MSDFRAVRLTHECAPVEIRELIYLPEQTCRKLLEDLREVLGLEEALVLSTCNRTEIYYRAEEDRSEAIIKLLLLDNGLTHFDQLRPYFQIIQEESVAVLTLFEVAMGLNSAVLGDLQIANQVKQSYTWSHEAHLAQAYIHRLLHTIFKTNKRVQQETPYRDGAASISYAATELAEELTKPYVAPKALVLGLGEMGTDVARNLDPLAFGNIDLCNRTRSKAEALAAETGAGVIDLSDLPEKLAHYDVILSSVSVDTPLLTSEWLSTHHRPQFLIDLSVPRSVAPEAEALSHIDIYNVDDIRAITTRTLARRENAIPRVREIIAEEMQIFLQWTDQLTISPAIHQIKAALEEIRQQEMARFVKRASEKEAEMMDQLSKSMMQKIMRIPIVQLKEACKRGEQESLSEAVRELFDLDRVRESIKEKNQG